MSTRKIEIEDLPKVLSSLEEGKSYAEIGKEWGVTRERIRQLAKAAGLQGKGLIVRRNKQVAAYEDKMKQKYGSLWKGGSLQKSDFMLTCREKLISKRNAARQAGEVFTITMDDIEWVSHCPILGIELNYFPDGIRQENSVSFCRADVEKGYVPGNVFVCSWRATRIKNDGSAEEHQKIADFMLSNLACQETNVV